MFKSKIIKFINKHILYFIGIFLIIASVILTNYFSSYKKKQSFFLQKLIENTYLNKTSISIFEKLNSRYETIKFKVQSGDTFEKLLNQLNITNIEKDKILKKVLKQKYANKLKKNQEIVFKIDKTKPYKVLNFSIEISKTKSIQFTRNIQSDNFSYKEIQKNLIKKLSLSRV